jgi:hypothetical protein
LFSNRIYFLLSFFLCYSCAQIVTPTGGEKDTTPPKLVEEKTFPKNGSVNFSGQRLELEFDEFVRLNNPAQNIVISPVPAKTPQYLLKGKTLSIIFSEPLAQNTTYTIQFGNAIVDFTEGNAANNLSYVFSTGSFLDSVSVSGIVTNAITRAPEKGIYVLLYDDLSDSAIFKSKPVYFGLTDAGGRYRIQHIRKANYRVYALRDQNADLIYNGTDDIGFMNEILNTDSSLVSYTANLTLFTEERAKNFVKKASFSGEKLTVILNRSVKNPLLGGLEETDFFNNSDQKYYIRKYNEDTLEIYLNVPANNVIPEISFALSDSTSFIDTIRFRTRPDFSFPVRFKLMSTLREKLDRNDSIRIYFPVPVKEFDLTKVILRKDSVPVTYETRMKPGIYFNYTVPYSFLKDDASNYSLEILPGAFTSVYSTTNDSMRINFNVQKLSFYGTLFFQLKEPSQEILIMQLLNDRGTIIYEANIGAENNKIKVEYLRPGNYRIRLIHDSNNNGKWDSGNVLDKSQPEKISWYPEVVNIRSNWDMRVEF